MYNVIVLLLGLYPAKGWYNFAHDPIGGIFLKMQLPTSSQAGIMFVHLCALVDIDKSLTTNYCNLPS